jgi:hypothetical protein
LTFALALAGVRSSMTVSQLEVSERRDWDGMPTVAMKGGLKLFWNVYDWEPDNTRQAYLHGFLPITLVDPYADRSGGGKERIDLVGTDGRSNPWGKPPYFERVIRQDILRAGSSGTLVQDIELDFELDARVAWNSPKVRTASGAATVENFEKAYFAEWATWYTLPLKWTRETYPKTLIGLYGRQPFNRDYWGIAYKSIAEIEKKHEVDQRIWQYVDAFVDFYVVDIYDFYDKPDSVFYMAANVEFNDQRARNLSDKPIYVYEWMRYHDSNILERNRELDPYLVEAMAVVPFFSGAKGLVLWGSEPQIKPGSGPDYRQLPLFLETLARIAALSENIGKGQLVIDEPAHVLWRARMPLVRRIEVSADECIVLALDPWQDDDRSSTATVKCGGQTYPLEMKGRHATLAHIQGGQVTLR